MENSISKFTEMISPQTWEAIAHVTSGLFILVIGLLIVRLLTKVVSRLMGKLSFLSENKLVNPLTTLFKTLLTLFVLISVLGHFGMSEVLVPLTNLVDSFLSAIPNIVGAGVIGYAGWIIAQIVSDLVKSGLGKIDHQIVTRTGNESLRIAPVGKSFVFIAVLLPIMVAALGVLSIPAISDPATSMINELMGALPNVIGAGIILAVAYVATKFAVSLLSSLLEGMGIDALPKKLGVEGLFTDTFTITSFIGSCVMFFSMLTAATAAVNTLGIEIISNIFAQVLSFGGGLFTGGIVLIIGNFLGTMAYAKLKDNNQFLASIARVAILGLVLAMGLKAMGLADNIVNMAFGLTLGSIAVAVALAFGLGGRDAASHILELYADRFIEKQEKK